MMRRILLFLMLLVVLVACQSEPPAPADDPPTEAAASEPTAPPTALPAPTDAPAPEPTAEPTEPAAPEWVAPMDKLEGVIQVVPSEGQLAVGQALETMVFPDIGWEESLISHGKLDEPVTRFSETDNERLFLDEEQPPLTVGTRKVFYIANTDIDSIGEVEFKLVGISEYGNFWVDVDRDPSDENIQAAMDRFDEIAAQVQSVFGAEHPLGIDGDRRANIFHPAATKVCNVNEANAHQCGLGGYFWGVNQFPTEWVWFSNMNEGLIMNFDAFIMGSQSYGSTLAHEYRHLVEFWYRDNTETWEAEGQAVLSEDLAGFRGSNISFANTYMTDPDVQLNSWISGSSRSIFHYGYGYVVSRYIYDRFGLDFLSTWAQYPEGGFDGLDQLFTDLGMDETAEQVWLDFLVTLVLFDKENTAAPYTFAPEFAAELDKVGSTTLGAPPRAVEEEVRQYGADIYRLISDKDITVTFTGSTLNPILGRVPSSGEYFWYGGRTSGMRAITLEADLTEVETATLNYSVYFKLSNSFGFGYVVISTDGGETWQQLSTDNMKGEKAQDDPFDFALTDFFYTGTSPGGSWNDETIDLSEYVGQEVLIRWEVDGDNRDTGMAIDNISIPEIGFYDDVESEVAGWTPEGWVRTTAYIPQTYVVTLITFEDGTPVVTVIELDGLNSATFDVTDIAGNEAYLIVAAIAPQSQQPTAYMIETVAK